MCKKCLNRKNNSNNRCRRNCISGCCDNRCDDWFAPILFFLIRDMTRNCRCGFVDKYERFRC